jgi:hypothetical protein
MARVVAAMLAGYLIRIALRRAPLSHGSRVGWLAESVLGLTAFIVGLGVVGVVGPPPPAALVAAGPTPAIAAGLAVVALAVTPLADLRDGFRAGAGVGLLVAGADLLRSGLGGPTDGLGHLVMAGAVAMLGAAIALLVLRTSQALEGADPAAGRRGRGR